MVDASTELSGKTDWIDELTDEQCMEIFWLYVESPDAFLQSHPPALLGQAMRYALKTVASSLGDHRVNEP